MKLTFRWYGEGDPVSLSDIRQIPCMSGIVSAVYDTPPGEVWPRESILALKPDRGGRPVVRGDRKRAGP